MIPLRKKLTQLPLIKTLSSIKITVVCLLLLFFLTWTGTVYQINNGLYASQEKFFHSFIFVIFNFLPLPGAQLVLWVLFVNLLCVAMTRFVYNLSHIGILIIHCGLLLYFVSAFVTLHCVEESNLNLKEGSGSNVSQSYRDWELAFWTQEGAHRKVTAFDTKNFKPGKILDLPEFGLNLAVLEYYPNADAYGTSTGSKTKMVNSSGIGSLKEADLQKEPEKNMPGAIFLIKQKDRPDTQLLLYGGEQNETLLSGAQGNLHVMLRHKRYPLPLTLTLKDFQMEVHPNTQVARSYKSLVSITTGDLTRDVTIFMNNPLRYKNFTFYQASYSIDTGGHEYSTLAVVKNSGRLLPYIASLATFAGLATHFLLVAFTSRKPRKFA